MDSLIAVPVSRLHYRVNERVLPPELARSRFGRFMPDIESQFVMDLWASRAVSGIIVVALFLAATIVALTLTLVYGGTGGSQVAVSVPYDTVTMLLAVIDLCATARWWPALASWRRASAIGVAETAPAGASMRLNTAWLPPTQAAQPLLPTAAAAVPTAVVSVGNGAGRRAKYATRGWRDALLAVLVTLLGLRLTYSAVLQCGRGSHPIVVDCTAYISGGYPVNAVAMPMLIAVVYVYALAASEMVSYAALLLIFGGVTAGQLALSYALVFPAVPVNVVGLIITLVLAFIAIAALQRHVLRTARWQFASFIALENDRAVQLRLTRDEAAVTAALAAARADEAAAHAAVAALQRAAAFVAHQLRRVES
jgi:hypothetical protein